jgi:amino acid adenylation domain-containing protein/non-ribosomal peptide synthase protein (TIGR01720 family)/FkbM family methyltransferase
MQNELIEGFRLSQQQERVWSLEQLGGNQPFRAYCAISIEGQLAIDVLTESLQTLVNRHEILRTSFHCVEGVQLPLQVIGDVSVSQVLGRYDLSKLSQRQQEVEIESLLTGLGERPFAYKDGPLLHLTLVAQSKVKHTLLLGLPALCADSVTLRNLVSELSRLYQCCLNDEEPADEPMQYVDISEWQHELLESDEVSVAKDYWKQESTATSVNFTLPFQTDVAGEVEFDPRFLPLPIERELQTKIETFCRSYGTSASVFFESCWQTLLWRLTGKSNLVVGVASNGRNCAELETAFGLFATYLPVQVKPAENTIFKTLMDQVKAATDNALRWQDGFAWETFAKQSAGATVPRFFTACFEFETSSERHEPLSNVSFTIQRQYTCFDRFAVKLTCIETTAGAMWEFHYDASVFSQAGIERLSGQFRQLVESVIENPHGTLESFEIVNAEERRQLLVELNRTSELEAPLDMCLHELFELQVERTPDALAVAFEAQRLTYRELNEWSNRLAHRLQKLGVGADELVALCADRSLEMVVGLLAILKSGAAYVPLDPSLPRERLAFLLKDTTARVLLTQRQLIEKLPPELPAVICLDETISIAQESTENAPRRSTVENLAYVIYTSGSTGQPKGVAVEHRQLVSYTRAIQDMLELRSGFSFALVSTFAADLGHTMMFPSLCTGGLLHVISQERASDPVGLSEYFQRNPIDCLKIVPSHLSALLTVAHPERVLPRRRLVLGGEASNWQLVEKISTLAPDCAIFNHYGPTETTVGVLTHRLTPRQTHSFSATPPMGRPIPGAQVYLVDSAMRPVPVGVCGELLIGGAGLARGYLNHAALSAEKFVPDPFSGEWGGRLYRTGDLARYLPGGEIEFLGRLDHQIKIHGFRIELQEIETTLRQHPCIEAAKVVVNEHVPGDKQLVAYLVPDREAAFTVRQLLRFQSSGQINGQRQYELPNGMAIVHKSKRETDFTYQEIFNDQIYLKHGITLKDDACVFDVGANIGLFSLFVGQRCKRASIYAFEPIPSTFELLRLNTALYGLSVNLFKCGLSNQAGEAIFTHYPYLSLMSGRYADFQQEREVVKSFESRQRSGDNTDTASEGEEILDDILEERLVGEQFACKLQTISDVIRSHEIQQIDLLKIDVQKSEMDVFEGIAESDWAKIRQIVVEVHDIDGRMDRVKELLERHGFDLTIEQEEMLTNTRLFDVYAVRPETLREQSTPASLDSLAQARPEWINPQQLLTTLRSYVKDKLPEQMLPAAFVLLDAVPLTPNGKVDYQALPAPEHHNVDSRYQGPRTVVEEVLVEIWREVLRVEQVGIHDNFFELGGDSILSIQIIARANQKGVRLSPRQLFQQQTIAALAQVAEVGPALLAEQETLVGQVPLTPIQRWFFAQPLAERQHFNQAVLLRLRQRWQAELLPRVVGQLLKHHDGLRLRYEQDGSGEWRQFYGPPEETVTPEVCSFHDLSGLEASEQEAALAAVGEQLQRSFQLEAGPLVRVALFDLGAGGGEWPQRLLLVLHHLVVDGVSWRIVLEDLQAAYAQASSGRAIKLGAKTSSYKQWAERLAQYAASGVEEKELEYWRAQVAAGREQRLPEDYPGGANTVARMGVESVWLTAAETQSLLRSVPAAYHTQINDVLLTALVQAFRRWTGSAGLLVELESHGREELFAEVDVTRTVGWFTSAYPVWLKLSGGSVGEELRAIQEQLGAVPGRGVGYGVARYLSGVEGLELAAAAEQAQVCFNYLGQFDQVLGAGAVWGVAREKSGTVRSAQGMRKRLLEINGSVVNGQLQLSWSYSREVHRRETIQELGAWYKQALLQMIAESATATQTYVPSDFPGVNLNSVELDELMAQLG